RRDLDLLDGQEQDRSDKVHPMRGKWFQKICLAIACIACLFVAWHVGVGLDGSEFSGGWLTGPLLSMNDIGSVLFFVALLITAFYPRIAASVAIAAGLSSLPLYVFFLAPVPFAKVFAPGHQFSVPTAGGIHWSWWPGDGLLTVAIMLSICVEIFRRARRNT